MYELGASLLAGCGCGINAQLAIASATKLTRHVILSFWANAYELVKHSVASWPEKHLVQNMLHDAIGDRKTGYVWDARRTRRVLTWPVALPIAQ